jgi:serine/threonine protein kinase
LRDGLDDQNAFHRLVAGIKGIPPGPTSSGDDLSQSRRTPIPPDTGPPHIEDSQGLLPAVAEPILKKMFAADYQRVVIKREFGRGLSGSRVFLVRPIRNDGRGELPAVIKMGPSGLIEKEWQAYQANIRNKLPNVAEIQDEPILSPDGTWSGLRYRFIGEEIESLYSYCRQAKVEDLRYVLARLFKKIEPNYWRAKKFEAEYPLQAGYDFLLPINLIIDPSKFPPAGTSVQSLGPDSSISQLPNRDDYVRLASFVVTEVDIQSQVVTLNLPASAGKLRRSCRLRLQPVGQKMMGQFEVGKALPIEIVGQVTATRHDLLEAKVKEVLGPDFDLATDTVILPNGTALRNPPRALSDILKESRDVYVASIHGDLNLENILVNRETRDISLIDFATARWDHVLHDLLRLETEVVTKLIPAALAEAGLPAETIHEFYQKLHQATFDPDRRSDSNLSNPVLEKPFTMLVTSREKAKGYFYDPDDPTEYYQGLVLYLLGALKFKNLDKMPEAPPPLPKQVAFWGAATLVDLLNPPSEPTEEPKTKRVEMTLEGEFEEFNETRRQDIVSVIAALLRTDTDRIRVLKVSPGSIRLVLEMPETAANRLYEMAGNRDFKLTSLGIVSIRVEDEPILNLTTKKIPSRSDTLKAASASTVGVTIGKVTGGIHGSIIAGRDVKNATITIGGQPTPAGQAPTVPELKRLLSEIQQDLAEISAQQDALKKVSPAAPFTTQGAVQSIKEAAATVKPELKPAAAKSMQQSLNEAATLLSNILEGATEREGEVANAVKPIADKLEPLVEKIGVAALWVAKLWLRE